MIYVQDFNIILIYYLKTFITLKTDRPNYSYKMNKLTNKRTEKGKQIIFDCVRKKSITESKTHGSHPEQQVEMDLIYKKSIHT